METMGIRSKSSPRNLDPCKPLSAGRGREKLTERDRKTIGGGTTGQRERERERPVCTSR